MNYWIRIIFNQKPSPSFQGQCSLKQRPGRPGAIISFVGDSCVPLPLVYSTLLGRTPHGVSQSNSFVLRFAPGENREPLMHYLVLSTVYELNQLKKIEFRLLGFVSLSQYTSLMYKVRVCIFMLVKMGFCDAVQCRSGNKLVEDDFFH